MCYHNTRILKGDFIMNKINECTIDFESVVTKEQLQQLSEEERAIIEKEATFHHKILTKMSKGSDLSDLLTSKSREIAFLNRKFTNLSQTAKECLAARIAFDNDENFIKCLLSRKITYYILFSYARAISSTKRAITLDGKLNNDADIEAVNKKLNNLCSLVRMYFGIRDYNLILAKINEIIVFKRDLYKKLEQEQFTPASKTR